MYKPKYITDIDQLLQINDQERKKLKNVTDKYVFRTNNYYLSLIKWNDPHDPLKRIVIPDTKELEKWGRLDASDEEQYTIVPGLEHKYEYTAVLIVNNVCGSYCRFCFRKRLFMNEKDNVIQNISEGIKYLREHNEVNNVLITGGDPLIMSTKKLENIIRQVREIKHINIIRIGTKIPIFNPYRIVNDPSLLEMLQKYSTDHKKIYIMAHYNHPNELTEISIKSMNLLRNAQMIMVNQTPMIRGVNDDPAVLGELFNKLSYIGIPPYYVFICRPTAGNKPYSVPIEEAFDIFEKARMRCSGLAKRARLVMSHSTGKIEIVGKTNTHIYFRYHRAANPQEKARFMIFRRNKNAYWFDDYDEIIRDYSFKNPYRCIGPD